MSPQPRSQPSSKSRGKGAVIDDSPYTEQIDLAEAADALETDHFDYSVEVIEGRSIPSCADGLKTVHRRILWDMHDQGYASTRGFVKSARPVGDTMARFHPHGDSSIYDALARMAQPFSLLAPLLDFHGNYGSPDFGPAASRYTETRLGPLAELLLNGVEDGTVAMQDNYDNTELEPVVLPAEFPNTLINGSFGVAVGLTSHLPTHNPGEVIAATQHLLANPRATIADIMSFIPGPDYPGPSQVINGHEIAEIYARGSGTIRVRGRWEIEEGSRGSQAIVITALPHNGSGLASITKFCTNVDDAVAAGDLPGVIDCNDESAGGRTRIFLRVATGVDPNQIAGALLKCTDLQVSNTVKMHFLDETGRVRLYNILTLLQAWIDHRVRVIRGRSVRRLEVIGVRLDRLDGYALVLLDIDRAIAIIRTSKTRAIALMNLVEGFGITEFQADSVLDLSLGRLTEDARIEFAKEASTLRTEQTKLNRLIGSASLLRKQVAVELDEAAKAFDGIERQTEIASVTAALPTAVVIDAPIEVVLTTSGYVQAFKDLSKARDVKGHTVMQRVPMSTAATLAVLTDAGQFHRVLGNVVPSDKATALQNVVQMETNERILLFLSPTDTMDDLMLVTSLGTIKRISGADLAGGDRRGGISIIKLEDGERLVAAMACPPPGTCVALVTALGQIIRFVPDDVRPMGRTAAGVRGIKLVGEDRVVGAVPARDGAELAVFHAKGSAKRVATESIPVQGRAGKGLRVTQVGGRHGDVVAITNGSAAEIVGRSADGELLTVSRSSIALLARDAAPAKIRSFDGVMTSIVNVNVTTPAPSTGSVTADFVAVRTPAAIQPSEVVNDASQPQLPLD